MLTYDTLARKPGAFTAMTGLTVDEFEGLLVDLRPRYEAARREERGGNAASARLWSQVQGALRGAGAAAHDADVAAPVSDRRRGERPLRHG